MPSREPEPANPQEPTRPPLTPSLAYEAASPSDTSPPTISAFVAEAVVYLSNAAVNETGGMSMASQTTTERDTTPVINAVVRLLDTMTATRFSHMQSLIADNELTNSSIGTDDLGSSRLDDFDLAFQMPDPDAMSSSREAILSDGSLVTFSKLNEKDVESQLAGETDYNARGPTADGFWRKIFNLGQSQPAECAQEQPIPVEPRNSFFGSAPRHIDCADVELIPVDAGIGTGPVKITPDKITNVQGYTWTSLADYQNDKLQRLKHFRRQLMGTRQFLERKSGPMLRQVVNNGSFRGELDIRRQKRMIWLKLYGVIPRPRLIAKLKFFHRLPEPIYDHFQLKNLLCLRADREVFYLSHQSHKDRKYTCVMSYNLQTQCVERVLGPWSFNSARPLSHNARPIYHSLASISFESGYLFSLAVSENYVATSDTSSSILLSKRKCKDGKVGITSVDFATQARRPTVTGTSAPNELLVAGHQLLCQRVSSQPLQIINSIQLIELTDKLEGTYDLSPRNQPSQDFLEIIRQQALDKSKLVFRATCQSLECLFEQIKVRVALGQAWRVLRRDPCADGRSLRRLRSLFTPSATAFMRSTVSIFAPEEINSQESSPENQQDHVPCPTNLTVLTAGNDKTLCEYSLESQMCRESTHILLDNGDSICKLRANGVSGFSACTGSHNARCKNVLRLSRSWQYPFCINRIAVHPDQNLLLLVGDSPTVILTARSAPASYYSGHHGSIKNSLFTIDFHQDASFAAAWHPNGLMFATGCDDRTVAIWDLRQLMAPIYVLRTEVTACRNLEFSPDGRFLLSCESEDAVVLYSVTEDFAVAQKVPFFGGCTGATFSSDSQRIIIGVGPPGGLMELVISRQPAAAAKSNEEYFN